MKMPEPLRTVLRGESEGNGREGAFGEKGNTEDARKELT
jgi:hypothetical protein